MAFDPRSIGCRCDECPLGGYLRQRGTWFPVPPEGPKEPKAVLVGEMPGANEERLGRPMIGASGQLLERTLRRLGYLRQDVLLTNALLCRPNQTNNLDQFMVEVVGPQNEKIKELNKDRPKNERLPRVPTPQEACRPHITRFVDQAARLGVPVIGLGQLGYWSITGRRSSIRKVRGSFTEFFRLDSGPKAGTLVEYKPEIENVYGPVPRIKVTATVNPAFALRKAPYMEVLYRDLERAFRWHKGELQWEDPAPMLKSIRPDPSWLVQWLAKGTWWSWDLETTHEGELQNKLRTVGIFSIDRKEGVIIPWVSIDGRTGFAPGLTMTHPFLTDTLEHQRSGRFTPWWDDFEDYHYDWAQGLMIRDALWRWFEDGSKWKVGHYSNYFDLSVMQRHLGPFRSNGLVDQILLARMWNSEFPRSLYFVGTMLTDVPAWKAAEDERQISRDPRSYEELASYNHLDNVVVGKTGPALIKVAQKQWDIAQLDHDVEAICREMHWNGLYVNESTRAQLEEETREKMAKERDTVARIVGPDFNPASTKQLGKLLYDDWRLPVPMLTNTGKPSTSEDAVRVLLTTAGLLNPEQRELLETVWRGRGFSKTLSTVLLPLRRRSQGGIVYDDGVLRADYGAHIPATGRMSSSNMNTQNIRKDLRAIIQPRPGHVFVISDYDQVELRIMSAAAQVQMYLEEFAKKDSDPHSVTALLVYGDQFRVELEEKLRTGKKSAMFNSLRRFAKTFVYAVLYGGTAGTVYENVSKATDPETGKLLFPNMTFQMVDTAVRSWMRNAPEIPAWWARTWKFVEEHGYVEEPIMGRRRHMPAFLRNEALNLPIQGAAAVIMSQGLVRLRRAFPPDLARGLGLVNQMHDAVTLEVLEKDAHRVADQVTEMLTCSYPDKLPGMDFTTQAECFMDWSEKQKF